MVPFKNQPFLINYAVAANTFAVSAVLLLQLLLLTQTQTQTQTQTRTQTQT